MFIAARPAARCSTARGPAGILCRTLGTERLPLHTRIMTLFTRLLLIIVVALLPPLAMQVFNEAALDDAQHADVRAEALRETRAVSAELEQSLDGVRNTLVALAEVPAIRSGDPVECPALLRAVAARFAFLREMQLVGPDGLPRCDSAGNPARDRSKDPAVRLALAHDNFAVGSYRADPAERPGLAMAYPVRDVPGAVLVADFDLAWLRDQILAHALPSGSVVTLADRDGRLLLRLPESERIGGLIRPQNRWMLAEAMPGVVERVGSDGVRRVIGYVPLASAPDDLFVSVGLSTEVAYAASDAAAWRGYTLIAAGFLAAFALATSMLRGMITRPVRAILAVTERWRAGDTSARVPPTTVRSEFGRIAGGVNDLLDAVVAGQVGLRDRLAELDAIYRSSAVGLGFVDHALRFVTVNAQLAEMDGVPEAEHRGRVVCEVWPAAADLIEPLLRRALSGERIPPAEVDAAAATEGGDKRRMLVSYQPAVAPDGQVLGAIVSVQDITALRRAEAALQDNLQRANAELERRMAERTEQLEAEVGEREAAQAQLQQAQKMELLGQLTGGVAHDFNNLLTAIIGNLELALGKIADRPEIERQLLAALRAADRGAALTQRMLAFGRRQYLRIEPVAIAPLLDGMADLLARTIGPPVNVQIAAAPDMRPARADPNQVELLVLNLAVNARDAMPDGGTIAIVAVQEEVGEPDGLPPNLAPGAYVRIIVTDTGTGMDAATRSRAFEPFFTTKPVGRGSGLGLSMVQGVAEQCGGGVAIESAPGRGTSVSVWLPCDEAAAPVAAEPAPDVEQPGSGARLLLVDDDPAVRGAMAEALQEAGYDVAVAAGGRAALALLSQAPLPSLMIVDLGLRDMGGAEVVAEARRMAPALQVLIATGADQDAAELGYPVLAKPFRATDLRAMVAALLRVAA
jgi:PAS domain S-box-containing protein